jgi:hypothetical protein
MKDLPNEPIESAQPFPCCNRPPASLKIGMYQHCFNCFALPITGRLGAGAVSAVWLELIGV